MASREVHHFCDFMGNFGLEQERLTSLMPKCLAFPSDSLGSWSQRLAEEHQAIDRFFGTNWGNSYRNDRLQEVGLPFSGFSSASKIAPIARRVLRNPSTLVPTRKLLQAKEYVSPHSIRFSQPTASQNFSSSGTINDMIKSLQSGALKVALQEICIDGKIIDLRNF
jgi:hypothetical protein